MNEPSIELLESVKDARGRLASAADGHLPLGARQRIWAAMGMLWHHKEFAIVAEGLERRTALAVACVGYVLPIWEEQLPDDRSPHELLASIGRYLRGEEARESLDRKARDLWSFAETAEYRAPEKLSRALRVGFAASQAASTALYDEEFDPASIDPAATDGDRDPWGWDAGFYAAMAHAGGNPISYARRFDPDRLRRYWGWYLDVAVPSSWRWEFVFDEGK